MSRGDGNAQSAQAIRDDIERTRARMGDTVESLGERLSISRIKQELKSNVRDATIGRVENMASNAKHRMMDGGRGIAGTVRDNPIPAAMIVGGLGWLLVESRRSHGPRAVEYEPRSVEYEPRWTAQPGVQSSLAEESGGVTARARNVAEQVSESAHGLTDKVSERAHGLTEKVAGGARSAAHVVAEQTKAQGQRVSEGFESNPLAIGAIAAAVGLAIGWSVPSTDREARLMGAKRDELMDRAKHSVDDATDKVKHAAQRAIPEVKETLKDVARDEGLASP